MEMTTLAEAIANFAASGYRGSFRAEESGLREVSTGKLYRPDDLWIDDLFRFEGASDPGDQIVLFALRGAGGDVRGTYVVAFGPQVGPLDAAAVRGLQDGRTSARVGGRGARTRDPGAS